LAEQMGASIATPCFIRALFIQPWIRPLSEAFADLKQLLAAYREHAGMLSGAEEQADAAYLEATVPGVLSDATTAMVRISTLVGSIQHFSNPAQQDRRPVDLNALVEGAVLACSSEHGGRVHITADLDPALPRVPLVAADINLALLNLLSNAVQAVPEQGEIRIITRHRDNTVEIGVEDNGTGIPAAIRDRIFDPFFTTRPVGGGSGTGLSQVRAAALRHQGNVGFSSEEGRGTCFILSLPVS
ncbi:MAG: sensor histidine kinase, partial [Candidatus Xenobia bacterium]